MSIPDSHCTDGKTEEAAVKLPRVTASKQASEAGNPALDCEACGLTHRVSPAPGECRGSPAGVRGDRRSGVGMSEEA